MSHPIANRVNGRVLALSLAHYRFRACLRREGIEMRRDYLPGGEAPVIRRIWISHRTEGVERRRLTFIQCARSLFRYGLS